PFRDRSAPTPPKPAPAAQSCAPLLRSGNRGAHDWPAMAARAAERGPTPSLPVRLGGPGRTGAELGVQAPDAGAVLADQLHAADDLRDRGLLLDLLVHEPVQQRAGVVVALLVGAAVQLADRLGDLLLVR